jgi:HSP20 family protein
MNKAFEQAYKEVKNPIMVDVIKNDDSYQVLANLPGVKKEDIKLSFKDSKLTIAVDKKEDEAKETKYVLNERLSGYNSRTVYLKDVDESRISAKLENGVLVISVPFMEKKANNIQID